MSPNFQIFNRQIRSSLIALAGVALLSAPSAIAQMPRQSSPPQTAPTSQPGVSPTNQANTGEDPTSAGVLEDKAFVRKALQGGMTEVQLGQLAFAEKQQRRR
jgi:putative membrane protein